MVFGNNLKYKMLLYEKESLVLYILISNSTSFTCDNAESGWAARLHVYYHDLLSHGK